MIIEWPKSQICMDCFSARWLTNISDESIVHPATECELGNFFNGDECPKRVYICDVLNVDMIPFNGFSWICPGCGRPNIETEQEPKVICRICERIFSVTNNRHKNGVNRDDMLSK